MAGITLVTLNYRRNVNVYLCWKLLMKWVNYGLRSDSMVKSKLEETWVLLQDVISELTAPFAIIGDFNQVLFHCDKLSNNHRSPPGMHSFASFAFNNKLIEISGQEVPFTWTNNRPWKATYKKLDRAFCSED